MQISAWRLPRTTGLALLAGFMFTACCPDPPPAPQPDPGCQSRVAPSTQAQLDACLKNLAFDSSDEASDEQPLTVVETVQGPTSQRCPGDASGRLFCRYGPMGTIQPAIGAQRYSEAQLREGRIIAKLSVPRGEKEGYKKYGLLPGQDTYWWVQTDSAGTGGISVFLTRGQDGQVSRVERPLKRRRFYEADYKRFAAMEYTGKDPETEGARWWRAVARWLWNLDDETANSKCGAGSCQ
jgi:hypothetical protein